MARWGVVKSAMRIIPKRRKSDTNDGGAVPDVQLLTRELAQESGRVPPEARADLAMIEVHLTRKTVPDEDPEQTLLKWLAERGFHDVLALRADASFEISKRKREGLDLCLWVAPERLLRAAINKDPTKPPKHAKDLSNEERTSLVQAAMSVLAEAKENKILSYKEAFLFHERTTLAGLLKLQGSYRMFWDRGDVLLDAIASYFGTKVGFYFAWLRFYTVALVFPTVVGLLLWWTERLHSLAETSGTCVPAPREADRTPHGVPGDSWWRWPVAVALSLADSSLQSPAYAGVAVGDTSSGSGAGAAGAAGLVSTGMDEPEGVGYGVSAGVSVGVGTGGVGGDEWDLTGVVDPECEEPTFLAPYFNLFLALWATLFLVLWRRRSHTLAFRWGVHKEDTIDRAKFMVGWKRPGRAGMTPEGILQRQTSFSSTSTAPLSSSGGSTHGNSNNNNNNNNSGNKPPPAPCKMLAAAGRRRQCAKGGFRATAAAVAAAAATARPPSSRQNWAVFGRGVGGGVREDGLEGGAWEPLRTARMFLSWSLEAALLYMAIRMMLWFAWLELRSLEKFGDRSFGVHAVRTASVILPSTFYGMHWKWAKALTTWEGHVTEAGAENSMTVKRFTFRCVNSYSRLFYLGFWQRDLVGLKDMLLTVLITRSFMDALQEVVAPVIQTHWRQRLHRKITKKAAGQATNGGGAFITHKQEPQQREHKPHRRRGLSHMFSRQQQQELHNYKPDEPACRACETACHIKKQIYRDALTRERMLPQYQTQQEYLNLMVQYGYVTMFAVALPLAPLLALVRCLAEIYIDHQKLLRCRRPAYIDRSSIGAWCGVLQFVGTASVLTNCLLLALAAEKLRLHIPVAIAEQFPNAKYIVMAVFVEHLILGVKAAVRVLIDDVPDGVERAMAEELLHDQEESRRKMEEALGFSEDVPQTHLTIIRRHHQPERQGDNPSRSGNNDQSTTGLGGCPTKKINGAHPSTLPDPQQRRSRSHSSILRDSSWNSNVSASSVHLLGSPPLSAARPVETHLGVTQSQLRVPPRQGGVVQPVATAKASSSSIPDFIAATSTPTGPTGPTTTTTTATTTATTKSGSNTSSSSKPPPLQLQQQQEQGQSKSKLRRRIWSRQSSRTPPPSSGRKFLSGDGDDNDDDRERRGSENGGRSSNGGGGKSDPRLRSQTSGGSEDGRDYGTGVRRRRSRGDGGSPGGWSDVGAVRAQAARGAEWESASADGGGGGDSGGGKPSSPASLAMQRSVFARSKPGSRRRLGFRNSSGSS